MPRLLSNKSPTKISEVRVWGKTPTEENPPEKKFEGFALRTSSEQKILKPVEPKSFKSVEKKKSLRIEEDMSSWEYYNFLMRFGKRRMVRSEWLAWKLKKDKEDMDKGYVKRKDPPLREKMSSAEYHWRLKKDPNFIDFVAEEEFSLDFKKNGDWGYL